jgi:GTPase SAR1 family protein
MSGRGFVARDLFTDRDDLSRLYLGYLNEDPARSTFLYFHGAGGNGKSTLLHHLRNHLTKRLSPVTWGTLRTLPDHRCVDDVIGMATDESIPVTFLDFGDDRTSRDAMSALMKLRRDLSGSALRFPLFDYGEVQAAYRRSN